jgi:sulfate adenylyltransferase subunit 1 (EFTu-like GTPase family)
MSTNTTAHRAAMNIVIVGHVDHGKSTLVGRLFYDTNSLPEGRYEAVARVCEDTGKPFEFAFLLDALEEERDQGITIGVGGGGHPAYRRRGRRAGAVAPPRLPAAPAGYSPGGGGYQ